MINYLRYAGLAVVFIWFFVGGVSHFTNTEFFVAIVPPWVPYALAAVYVSGIIEIILALLIVSSKTRSAAGWGLIALTLAVTPANVHMWLNPELFPEVSETALTVRLVVQVFLLLLIWWSTRVISDRGKIAINGSVAPGFEPVKTLFAHNMETLAEENAQLCVYVGEDKVVDLWASVDGDATFNGDSLVNVFSSGKSLEAIAMASLVAKGLLNYDAKVAQYWPEFGAEGKHDLTVADLMRHEAGLAAFDVSFEAKDLLRENIKQNKVGNVIENHVQKFREGEDKQREYHAVTRGWIVNEVFRRVDPKGRTIGEFLREDLSGPLGADVVIGIHESELDRVARISPLGIGSHFLASMRPRFLGRKVKHGFLQLMGRILRMLPNIRNRTTLGAPAPFEGMENIETFNNPEIAMGETPSANAHCSARGLAHVAAMMATGGKWRGTEFVSEQAWAALHDKPIRRDMGLTTTFTQGGVALFEDSTSTASDMELAANQGREGFYGWMGLGGSIFQWHPEKKIGFSFVPTSLHVLDLVNERGKAYQNEVLKCLAA